MDLDSGAITLLEALDRISSIKSEMELKKERLQEINANQSNNEILDGLVKLYDNSCLSLERIKSKSFNDMVAISSEIKYTYIEMLMHYKDYMEQIVQ